MSDTTTTEATDKEQAMATSTPPDGTPSATAMKALNPAPTKASTKKATPKKATKPTAKRTTAKAAPAPKLEANKVDRIKAASAEAKAAKAAGWKRNKDSGEWERVEGRKAKPPTPNLDAINGGDAGGSGKEAKAPKRQAATQTVRLFHDSKPMPDSQNKLSSVAYYYTKGIGGEKVARITTDALRTLVAKESGVAVDDLATTAWSVKLPNGVKLSAKVERKASTSKAA